MTTDWQPSAEIRLLQWRAQRLADIRRFFNERAVWEVDTPVLSQAAPTSPYLDSFATTYQLAGSEEMQTYFLQTSPEFAMKRLLAAGSGAIFQIAKVFRNGEKGRYHAPEFTMLEWYRPDFSLHQLMDEVEALISQVFQQSAAVRIRYQQLFRHYLDLDVFLCEDHEIARCAKAVMNSLTADFQTDRDSYLELLLTHVIDTELACRNVFVYDFPSSQAQLARTKKDEAGNEVADRFELYVQGIEIANGYYELQDAEECRQRFESENRQRAGQSKAEMPLDTHLLAAMASGMPACSGVALGLDRLIMLAADKSKLAEVISFDFERA